MAAGRPRKSAPNPIMKAKGPRKSLPRSVVSGTKAKALKSPEREVVNSAAAPPPAKRTRSTRTSKAAHAKPSGSAKQDDVGPVASQAAREVYSTLEIRHRIFSLLDKSDLAGMLRLEKAATASVAAILYHTVPVSQMSRMSRASPRRIVYCDAVRVLDRNPPPRLPSTLRQRNLQERGPTCFDAAATRSSVAVWRKKYPNLRSVLYNHPPSRTDDAYVLYLSADDTITVDLDTSIEFNTRLIRFPAKGDPLPPSPTAPGFDIRQSLHVTVSDKSRDTSLPYNEVEANAVKWLDWLRKTAGTNKRISSIAVDVDAHDIPADCSDLWRTFLTARKDNSPVTRFHYARLNGEYYSQELWEVIEETLDLLGQELKSLVVDVHCSPQGDAHSFFARLHARFPNLEHLDIHRLHFMEKSSLESLGDWTMFTHLRELCLPALNTDSRQPLALPRYLAHIGTSDCIYNRDPNGKNKRLNDCVSSMKSYRPDGEDLRHCNPLDLDIWDYSTLPGYNSSAPRRRLAWGKLETQDAAIRLAASQASELSETVKTESGVFQELLGSALKGLADAKGDKVAEKEVLTVAMGSILGQSRDIEESCGRLIEVLQGLKAVSGAAEGYAATWIRKQELAGNAHDWDSESGSEYEYERTHHPAPGHDPW